jgi:hypothetical protein
MNSVTPSVVVVTLLVLASGCAEDDPPEVRIEGTGPVAVGARATTNALATDDTGVVTVGLYVDGFLVTEATGAAIREPTGRVIFEWSTLPFVEGEHVVEALATDTAGQVALSSPVTYVFDHTPPAITVTSTEFDAPPADILVTLADNIGISSMRCFYSNSAGQTRDASFVADAPTRQQVLRVLRLTSCGTFSARFSPSDLAGNRADLEVTISVGTTDPACDRDQSAVLPVDCPGPA